MQFGGGRVTDRQTSAPALRDDYTPDPNRWKALGVCLAAGFMTLLDVSIVNVALPSIHTGIGAGENELSWIVSGYALTFGLLLVPAGRVGDARGRRSTFMVGVGLFTLASAVCGFAPNATVLVIARLVQGLGGGLVTPQVNGLIQQLFRGAERGVAFGIFGGVVGISTAIGPIVGGLLIAGFGEDSGWRYVFFVNLPIGVLTMLLALRYIPHNPAGEGARTKHDLDPVGVLLLGLTVLFVIFPFIEQQQWHSVLRPLMFPVAAVLAATFIWWDLRYLRRGREPVVNLRLFAIPSYRNGVLLGMVYFAGFTGIFFIYAQALQEGLAYSALMSGVASLPFAIGSGASAALSGKVVTRFGRPLVVIGAVLVLIGALGMAWAAHVVTGTGLGWAAALPLLVAGIGSGLVISPNITLTVAEVPVSQAGVAGGMQQTAQRVGSAAGIAITGSVFYGVLQSTGGAGRPDFGAALVHGMLIVAAFVAAAMLLGIIEVVGLRMRDRRPQQA